MMAVAGLPRASTGGQGAAVRALYLELLREAGVTGEMFKSACKRAIMQEPPPGKTKYFPDPGQIAALCKDDIEDRKRALAALTGAFALLEAPAPAPEPELTDEMIAKRRRDLEAVSEKLRAMPRTPTAPRRREPAEPRRSTAEVVDELRAERGDGGRKLAEQYLSKQGGQA